MRIGEQRMQAERTHVSGLLSRGEVTGLAGRVVSTRPARYPTRGTALTWTHEGGVGVGMAQCSATTAWRSGSTEARTRSARARCAAPWLSRKGSNPPTATGPRGCCSRSSDLYDVNNNQRYLASAAIGDQCIQSNPRGIEPTNHTIQRIPTPRLKQRAAAARSRSPAANTRGTGAALAPWRSTHPTPA
jgi:hypothetical protein